MGAAEILAVRRHGLHPGNDRLAQPVEMLLDVLDRHAARQRVVAARMEALGVEQGDPVGIFEHVVVIHRHAPGAGELG